MGPEIDGNDFRRVLWRYERLPVNQPWKLQFVKIARCWFYGKQFSIEKSIESTDSTVILKSSPVEEIEATQIIDDGPSVVEDSFDDTENF